MGKATATKRSVPAQSEIERYEAVVAAKQQFVSATLDMGWRMALIVLIPVIVGVKLDDYFDTKPSLTLAALFLAVGGASVVAWRTIKQVNKEQAATSRKGRK